jgi:hypothetical protein
MTLEAGAARPPALLCNTLSSLELPPPAPSPPFNPIFFDRLATGFKYLPGRWFPDHRPEALLQLLVGRPISLAAVRKTATGLTLEQALHAAGYRDDEWQCSSCEAFLARVRGDTHCKRCVEGEKPRLNGPPSSVVFVPGGSN